MTAKKFYDWQTAGGANDVMRFVNFKGGSKVSIQLSTEEVYLAFPDRAVAADVHGILLRVASLEDTLTGKILTWSDSGRRQSKRIKDFADIARLVESHPRVWGTLPVQLQAEVEKPPNG